ncbi:PKD domain-containing protein [Aquiflexum lacus]|uniref:PKD domain-containing protein n=1 Tax=Aquiflexum lacus TaxID=2483805 RepID=UPI0018961E11|nr:PKD domain-containing protein [Aquiflexum lacus]
MKTKLTIILALGLHFILPIHQAFAQSCTQNNIVAESFTLRDANGNPFSPNDDYEIGDAVTGQIFVTFSGSSTNAYSLKTTYDVYINGVLTVTQGYACLFNQQKVALDTPVFVNNFTWNWGDVVEVRNVYVRWSTNSNSTCSEVSDGNSQCYYSADGFVAAVPLFPEFSYVASYCDPLVQFNDLTVGGYSPYSFAWDFDGLGISTVQNPSFSFPQPGSYEVTLTTTDNSGTVRAVTQTVTIPVFDIQVEITPSKINSNNGSIKVDVSGGNAPYSIAWQSDPSGYSGSVSGIDSSYTINNLPSGNYSITVTDAIGCTVTENYFLEWSSILSQKWDSFEAKLSQNNRSVKIEWITTLEKYPCKYYIERSIEGISNFKDLGSVKGYGYNEGSGVYEFLDRHLPAIGGRVYYRIRTEDVNDKVYLSKVISILVPEQIEQRESEWLAYPNPIAGNSLTLKFQGLPSNPDNQVQIFISSITGSLHKSVSVNRQTIVLDEIIKDLPKGILLVEIIDGYKKETIRVVKK